MNILSFDIEEWFHILDNGNTNKSKHWNRLESRISDNLERILHGLEANNQKATFFCLGWIAKKYPHLIREIHNAGHEIGSHGHFHQLVYTQDKKKFTRDLVLSLNTLQDIIGTKIVSFRAPGFSITQSTPWAFESLIENGIEIDSSVFPAPRAHGGFPSYGESSPSKIQINGSIIKEFPINLHFVLNIPLVFSGGGYFRLLPYFLIRRWCTKSDYIMTYFHPRDFDPDQPIIPNLSHWRVFKSYVGLKKSHDKFLKILKDFQFVDIRTGNELIDWDSVKVFSLDDLC